MSHGQKGYDSHDSHGQQGGYGQPAEYDSHGSHGQQGMGMGQPAAYGSHGQQGGYGQPAYDSRGSHGQQGYDARDYEERINRIFARHPYVDVNKMMHNDRLGFEPHEKQRIEEEMRYGRPTQQHFSKSIASKGPNQMRYLAEIAREHEDPRYRAFADDLQREFRF